MAKKKTEKPGQLTACPECGSAVIVVQDGDYEPVGFTQTRLEQAIRGAYELGSESGSPPVGYPVTPGPELDKYIAEWCRPFIEQAQERARA